MRACANHVVQPGSLFTPTRLGACRPARRGLRTTSSTSSSPLRGRAARDRRAIPDRLALYRVHAASKSGGGVAAEGARLRALRGRVPRESGLPGASEGRASAYLAAGDYFYDAAALSDATSHAAPSLRLRPLASRRGAAGAHARALRDAVVARIGIDATSVAPEGKGISRVQRGTVEALRALGRHELVVFARHPEQLPDVERDPGRRPADAPVGAARAGPRRARAPARRDAHVDRAPAASHGRRAVRGLALRAAEAPHRGEPARARASWQRGSDS